MSLTATDLQEIGNVIESALSKQTREIIEPLEGEIRALSNDIKEIYAMISELQSKNNTNTSDDRLSIEEKILRIHSELLAAAKQAGVTLPNQQ